MHGKSSLIALGIEPMFLEELRMCDDATSSALALLHREAVEQENKAVVGKYGKISSAALCALFNVSTGQITTPDYESGGNEIDVDTLGCSSAVNHEGDSGSTQGAVASEFCVCDISLDLITDPVGNCKCCLKRVRSITYPSVESSCLDEYPMKLKMESSEGVKNTDDRTVDNKKVPTTFAWNRCGNDLEMYIYRAVSSYDLGDDIRVMDTVRFGSNNMPIGRLTSTLLFPSYIEDPCNSQDAANEESRDPGDFDKLIYHVQRGHETSPDVCFANQSLNHISASDDGKIYLWVQNNQSTKFTSTTLYTKCVNKWLCRSDSATASEKRFPSVLDPAFIVTPPPKDGHAPSTVVGNSNVGATEYGIPKDGCDIPNNEMKDANVMDDSPQATYDDSISGMFGLTGPFDTDTFISRTAGNAYTTLRDDFLMDVDAFQPTNDSIVDSTSNYFDIPKSLFEQSDAFTTEEPLKPSMMGVQDSEERQSKTSTLFKTGDAEKQNMQESGHHYVITDITWSRCDKYIFIADSIVTRYNVKKLITASRTILSGISVFNSKGDRVADFLHTDISHHVGCIKSHPISEDIALAITYGGVIYVLSVENQSIIKKFDCGPNAVWLDADWHPTGLYFATCQSFGCFSVFTMEGLMNQYRSTLNHQCGYSDLLSVNQSTLYHGTENDAVQLRRYYYGSTLMPPVELPGKRSDESLRVFTLNSVNTVLDENRYEVLYVSNDVPMQVDDSAIWRNRIFDDLKLSPDLTRSCLY